jgi:hypothetical protein
VFVYTLQIERQKVSIGLNYEQTEEKQKVEKNKEEIETRQGRPYPGGK